MGTHPVRKQGSLAQMQAGRPVLIQKDGGEMLIAIVLDRPLADAKALVFFPSSVADVALKARSLHEHKLDRHLYKDKSCPLEQANRY